MGELTIEDKAKRYDEASKWMEGIYPTLKHEQQMEAEAFFPELKESEDERIRKELICFLETEIPQCNARDMYITWLKKQGEQKPTDKAKSKFHEGDWLQYRNAKPFFVEEITEQGYVNGISCLPFDWENEIHLWTLQDAKDGDILTTCSDDRPFILKVLLDENNPQAPVAYCGIDCEHIFRVPQTNHWWTGDKVHPATKEQRDALMKAMADAGYTFDFDKKELKKIEQKPAWSEEDEKMLKVAIESCEQCGNEYAYYWLKSLKDRVG